MKLIPNWQNQNLTCHFCGETRSVKYSVPVMVIDTVPENTQKEVCVCNKCALHSVFTGEDSKCETY